MAELMKAIVDRDTDKVINILKEMTTEQVNGILGQKSWENYSLGPLHLACLYDNTSAVTALLGVHGIDVNQTVTEMLYSSQEDCLDLRSSRWAPGFGMIQTYEGYTPIMIAAVNKRAQIFSLLVHDDRVDLMASVFKWTHDNYGGSNKKIGLLELLKSNEQKSHMLGELVAAMNHKIKLPNLDALMDLSSTFGQLLESGEMADFKIVCGEEEILCHKNILMARTTVLRSMINTDIKESRENRMEITDLNPKIVKLFVKFIYTGMVASDDLENYTLELFEVADRYDLNGLIKLCEEELISTIDNENVLATVANADIYHSENLREACIQWIIKHRSAIVKPEGWEENLIRFPNLLIDIKEALTS